jgi:hypothetical protein
MSQNLIIQILKQFSSSITEPNPLWGFLTGGKGGGITETYNPNNNALSSMLFFNVHHIVNDFWFDNLAACTELKNYYFIH